MEHVAQHGGAREAPLLFANTLPGSSQAACVNGVAGRAPDYDDVSLSVHPSTVLVPTLLAQAHRLGASGRDGAALYAQLASNRSPTCGRCSSEYDKEKQT